MSSLLRLWLVVVALLAGALLAACDGNGDNGDDGDQPTATMPVEDGEADEDQPTATMPAEDGEADQDGGVAAGGDAFEDVPLPAGAKETQTLTMSGSELPFLIPPGADVDAEALGDVTMIVYEVEGSPGDVIAFYKDHRDGWEEVFGASTDEAGVLIWTRDGGDRAVWIVTSEGSEAGTTELSLVEGRLQQ